jgi:hypothetical protein
MRMPVQPMGLEGPTRASSNDLAWWRVRHWFRARPDMHLNADPYVTSYVARAAEVSVPTRTVRSVTGPGLCGLAVLIRNCVHVHSGNGMRSAGGEMVR